MKKFLMAALLAMGALASFAAGDCCANGACSDVPAWKQTLGKVQDLTKDTGISGFMMKEAPAYITGNFEEADRPAKPDFSKPLVGGRSAYANRNGFWVVDEVQVKTLSTEKHPVKLGDWIGGYFDGNGAFVKGHEVKTLLGMPYGVGQLIMIPLCLIMMYLAIVKGFEPLLLLPIGFGGLLANCPLGGVTAPEMLHDGVITFLASGLPVMQGGITEPGGFLYYFFKFGIDTGVFPIMIFMGVGAMTDFGPLIANPKMALLGGAAQFGIFFALFGALGLAAAFGADFFGGVDPVKAAASIGIIGGADGPTAIWLTSRLAPDLLGAIAVAAYSYMALVPIIQPPIMNMLTTKNERLIKMPPLREVKKIEKICFPLIVLLLCAVLLPSAVPLIGALMLGNLAKEVGPNVARIADTMSNALINIVTIMLGLSVGSKLACEKFLSGTTLGILALGLCAFCVGTAAGVVMAKIMNLFSKEKVNPLIGSAGVSAVPMAARVSNKVSLGNDPTNFLLMQAMGPNVSGVIGSAVVAGVLYTLCR